MKQRKNHLGTNKGVCSFFFLKKNVKITTERNDYVFNLVSKYFPSGDQPNAIKELVEGIKNNKKDQVLLGATGTGKTFTIANVIKEVNKPTLVLAHNKTLAGQLYSELKELFPNNHVCYFVSYYDILPKPMIFGVI